MTKINTKNNKVNNSVATVPARKKDVKYHSIVWRLLLYFLTTTLLVVFVVSFYIAQNSQYFIQKEIETKLQSIGLIKADELVYWISEARSHFEMIPKNFSDVVALLVELEAEKTEIKRNEIRKKLLGILESSVYFDELFVLDPKTGNTIVSTNKENEGRIFADTKFFKQGKKGVFMENIYQSSSFEEEAITISMPFKDNRDELINIMAGRLNITAFQEYLFGKKRLGKTGEMFLVNKNFYSFPPIGYEPGGVVLQQKQMQTVGALRALRGEKGVALYKNYNNQNVIGFFQYIPEYEIGFIAEQLLDEAFAPIRRTKTMLYIGLGIALIMGILLSAIVSKRVSDPLKKLTDAARRIQIGDFKAEADINTNDEFDLLAKTFKRMTEALVLNLNETKHVIEVMPNALFILDTDGDIRSANQSAIRLTEFLKSELIGKRFSDILRYSNDTDKEGLMFDIERLRKEGSITNLQLFCFSNFHQNIPVSLSGVTLKDKDKKVIGYIAAVQDLRELKEYARKRLAKITPILHRISLGDFSEKIAIPVIEDEFTDLMVSIDLMAENLQHLVEENRKKTADLVSFQKELQLSNTDLKEAKENAEEEKSRTDAYLASIGDGIIAIDLQGQVIMINDESERMFQKTLKDVAGKSFEKSYLLEDENGNKLALDRYPISDVMQNKKQVFSTTFFARKDGSRLPLATTFSPILLADDLLGIICTFRDITKEMEVDKAKSEFVSLASHQLRTPLTGIKWLLQEIERKGGLDDMQTEYLADALKSSDRMVRLVGDLLNVSRLETGIISVTPKETNISEFIQEIVKEVSALAQEKDQTIEFIPPSEPISITLDKSLIGQVISNLLSNSVVYSPKGGKTVITAEKVKGGVNIFVKDQGIGMTKEEQEKLFNKFFRTAEANKFSTTGSGLGLYIIKKVLDVCNGNIRVESEKGKGTKFIVFLPEKGPVVKGGGDKKLIS